MEMASPPRLMRLADSPPAHGDEGGQGHQGQGEGDDQRPAEAAEEQVNHQNHQEDALGDGRLTVLMQSRTKRCGRKRP